MNSEGLLLLTNDGALARKMELPVTGLTRTYRVRVHGFVEKSTLAKLKNGITINGIRYGSVDVLLDRQVGHNAWLSVALKEGKNREIRNVLQEIGLRVNRLIRIGYGRFSLGSLPSGETNEISSIKIKSLRVAP
jgi:23S rRNA pseudouridine2605 synthase